MIDFKTEGGQNLLRMGIRFREVLPPAIEKKIRQVSEILVATVQFELLKGPKDVPAAGVRLEHYSYPRNPTVHLRVRTGRLRGSVGYTIERKRVVVQLQDGYEVTSWVGPQRVIYSRLHEFGGSRGPHGIPMFITARPYLAPALKAREDHIVAILGSALSEASVQAVV